MCCVPHAAYCQKDAQEQRPTPGTRPKPSKPKPGKTTNKGPRAVTAKPKIKATPAAQAQPLLTQVFHPEHKSFNVLNTERKT